MNDRPLKLAQTIAPRLDGDWRFNRLASDNHPWGGRLILTDDTTPGRTLHLQPIHPNGKPRLKIFGTLPCTGRFSGQTESITVSVTRTPHAIAADINRRLLPSYLTQWDIKQGELDAYNAETAEHLQKIELLRPVCSRLRAKYGGPIHAQTTDFHFDGGSFTMHRSWSRFVLELDTDFETAVQVLHFVKSLKKAAPDG